MRELRITDAELQELIGSAIRERLKKAGFRVGTPSDDLYSHWFAVDLQADVSARRGEDGVWTFRQEQDEIASRLADSDMLWAEAIANSAARPS